MKQKQNEVKPKQKQDVGAAVGGLSDGDEGGGVGAELHDARDAQAVPGRLLRRLRLSRPGGPSRHPPKIFCKQANNKTKRRQLPNLQKNV